MKIRNGIIIGMDLDEVIANFVKTFLIFYEDKYGKKINYEEIRTHNFWENGIGENKEDSARLVDEFYDSDYFDKISLVEGTREFLEETSLEGKILIVTSRSKEHKVKTNLFLTRHLPKNEFEVIYSGDFHGGEKSKAEICRERGINLFFEDNLSYASDIAGKGTTVVLPNKPWNQGENRVGILRINSWHDARRILADFGSQYGH